MTHPWYDAYWPQWLVQNILPNPAWWLLAAAPAVIWRRRVKAWWHRHLGVRGELDELREIAGNAHRIAADLWHHATGDEHPHAPGRQERP